MSTMRNWFATPPMVSAIRQAASVLQEEQTGKHAELTKALREIADSLEQYAMLPKSMPELEDNAQHPAEAAGTEHERHLEIEGYGQWLYEQGQISDEDLHKGLESWEIEQFRDTMRGMGWHE